jgi:hypothetical protein
LRCRNINPMLLSEKCPVGIESAMQMTTSKLRNSIPLFLSGSPEDSTSWDEKDWTLVEKACHHAQLLALLCYRLKDNPLKCPPSVVERLKNLFDLSFARAAFLKSEIEKISGLLLQNGLKLNFLKGYPLALRYYPHMACRTMQDVDCQATETDLHRILPLLRREGYSQLADQSRLEKKTTVIKLLGQHVFSIEFHRTLHTPYFPQLSPLPDNSFDPQGFPSPETLFLSILLHHKYYECSFRDLIDLHFVLKKNPGLNWKVILDYCFKERLHGHFLVMNQLYEKIFRNSWTRDDELFFQSPFFPKVLRYPLCQIRFQISLWRPKKRGLYEKICDAVLVFFVYDAFLTGIQCFINKYIRYVVSDKYRKMIMK